MTPPPESMTWKIKFKIEKKSRKNDNGCLEKIKLENRRKREKKEKKRECMSWKIKLENRK